MSKWYCIIYILKLKIIILNTLKVHTVETAPQESKASLEQSHKAYGMIPNLHAVLAESPNLLEAYKALNDLFVSSSFNTEEFTVVWQTINVEHECHYCVPAHTAVAHSMKVDGAITEALRNQTPLADNKLEVLRETTLRMVRSRGRLTEAELENFYNAGYTQKNVLDIILGLSHKTISNYTNHIANTPVDGPFQPFAWKAGQKA